MELFGVLIGLVVVGYIIYFLLLPFILSGFRRRIAELEKYVRELEHILRKQSRLLSDLKPPEAGQEVAGPGAIAESAEPVAEEAPPAQAAALEAVPPAASEITSVPEVPPAGASAPATGAWIEPDRAAAAGRPPAFGAEISEKIRAWLLGGNTVARLGVVILFLGVAFLLKYAVDRGWFPIELRLIGAALGGLALIATGWRLRARRLNYALVLQGGGVGIVYLTVFAAVHLYDLLATGPGLLLMVVLVALSSALAVLQDARSLALLAMVGGFLAPVLISPAGSHVARFSYYAVLNGGILGLAWFKSWRELNLIGFVFTFVIGALWGHQYYQPAYFPTTEPFLILFFLFYVAVPVLFALRQPPDLKGYVDGSLVFGVPLVAFGLQSALVRDFEYGLALSALAAGIFYVLLAGALWRGRHAHLRMLTEAFLALAVAFGTVAIPLAVDGRWTGAAWALEGAALVWVGVRQQRRLARLFGLLVQLGAGLAFLTGIDAPAADVPVLNSFYLSAVMVSFSGLFTAFYLYRNRQNLAAHEVPAAVATLVWGLGWWFGAGIHEIARHVAGINQDSAALGFVAGSIAVITALRKRLDWQHLAYPPLLLLPVMTVIAIVTFAAAGPTHPFAHGGWVAWPAAFAVQYWLLRRLEGEWPAELVPFWHSAVLWVAVFLVTWEATWMVRQAVPAAPTWRFVTWALVPAVVVMGLPKLALRLRWPVRRYKAAYLGPGLLPFIVMLGLWVLFASTRSGDPWPLAYLPVLNPLELTQCLVLYTLLWWSCRGWVRTSEPLRWYTWSVLAFITLNGMIARATHYLGNVSFDAGALWSSPTFQSVVSITWTLAALAIMVTASRLKQRPAWIVGAALLGAVVVKLFLVDLADIGTVARIVSFIVVGLLILLIGYLSPLPPRIKEGET